MAARLVDGAAGKIGVQLSTEERQAKIGELLRQVPGAIRLHNAILIHMDLRERLVACWREEHLSQAALAARSRVSTGTVSHRLRRGADTGSVAPTPHGGGRQPRIDATGAELLRAFVAEQNDRTLAELGALYAKRRSVVPSRSALSRRLIQLGLGRKKSH